MKLQIIIISFILSFPVLGQVIAPYHQSFDELFDFWGSNFHNKYVPGSQVLLFDLHRWAPREKSTYFYNYWYINKSEEVIGDPNIPFSRRDFKPQSKITWKEPRRMEFVRLKDRKGRSVKLTTLDQYDNSGGIDDTIRSRTEIVISPEHTEGSAFFYSWSFMIPTDENPDDPISDNIIAQWHEPINIDWELSNVQPPFFLTYKNDVNTKDNIRNLGVMYGLRYGNKIEGRYEGNYHSFPIEGKIEKGKWNDIILHINWSSNPLEGFMEMWLNGEKIDFEGVSKFYAANMYTDTSGNTLPNFMKIGQYRLGQTNTQSIYIDDFRIGNRFEEVNVRTEIINCKEKMVVSNGDILRLNEVIGANGYQFYFINKNKIITRKRPYLKIKKSWLLHNNDNYVKARIDVFKKTNMNEGFGKPCHLTFIDK